VFAELVFYELSKHYGRDVTKTVGRYLAGHKVALPIVPHILVDVRHARDILLGREESWK
jgi:hypothetical protein